MDVTSVRFLFVRIRNLQQHIFMMKKILPLIYIRLMIWHTWIPFSRQNYIFIAVCAPAGNFHPPHWS